MPAIGATVTCRSARVDNLVLIGHGCSVGEGRALVAQVGLSGSTQVARFVRTRNQVGLAGHLTIGDGAQLAAKSGVSHAVGPGEVVGG